MEKQNVFVTGKMLVDIEAGLSHLEKVTTLPLKLSFDIGKLANTVRLELQAKHKTIKEKSKTPEFWDEVNKKAINQLAFDNEVRVFMESGEMMELTTFTTEQFLEHDIPFGTYRLLHQKILFTGSETDPMKDYIHIPYNKSKAIVATFPLLDVFVIPKGYVYINELLFNTGNIDSIVMCTESVLNSVKPVYTEIVNGVHQVIADKKDEYKQYVDNVINDAVTPVTKIKLDAFQGLTAKKLDGSGTLTLPPLFFKAWDDIVVE